MLVCISHCGLLLCCVMFIIVFFFFQLKTAYDVRISDWSSDLCSSDLEPQYLQIMPGLTELLAYARAGDTLAVVRLDRLGRSLGELKIGRAECRERVCQYV